MIPPANPALDPAQPRPVPPLGERIVTGVAWSVLIIFAVAFVAYCTIPAALFSGILAHHGELVETRTLATGPVDIRVRVYPENGVVIAGSFYHFDARPRGEEKWREVLEFRYDGLRLEPPGVARVVDDRTAFIHISWVYAVTTDGGRTWTTWDALEDLPGHECCNYGLIDSVHLEPDGRGTMRLDLVVKESAIPELRTTDFGRSWERVPPGAKDYIR